MSAQPQRAGAVDAWATPLPPRKVRDYPGPVQHVMTKYGAQPDTVVGVNIDDMLREMDGAGVEWAVLSSFMFEGEWLVSNDEVAAFIADSPDRFVGACCVDPRYPMPAIRELRRCVEDLGYKALRLFPYQHGTRMVGVPPTDKMYWPLYTACVEYDIPVALQIGHTGPTLPSECGRPIYLDEVALTFPELRLVGTHLGDPWADEIMALAWKHPNLYVETSARAPRHWTPEFKKFATTYGADKVLWATDYPLLPFGQTLAEIDEIGFRSEEARSKVVRDNAMRVFKIPGSTVE